MIFQYDFETSMAGLEQVISHPEIHTHHRITDNFQYSQAFPLYHWIMAINDYLYRTSHAADNDVRE